MARLYLLAGGPEAPAVVIPTAGAKQKYDEYWQGLRPFRTAGITRITLLHTTDRAEADSEEFVRPLERVEKKTKK